MRAADGSPAAAAPRSDRSAAVKDAIRSAAGRLFAERGFQATGVRDIAREAGADPALVIRHFGSKEGLFLETMAIPGSWSALLAGPLEGMGERLVAAVLSARDSGGLRTYAALIRASDRPEVAERLRDSIVRTFVEPVAHRLPPPDAALRARMLAALLDGLLTAIAIREDPLLLAMPPERLARWYGAVIDGALHGPLPPG